MVVTASAGGDQDPPQGSGIRAANSVHVSTSTQEARDTPGPNGSRPTDSSQAIPENNIEPSGTIPVSVSTTAPASTSANEIPLFSTNAANNLFNPGWSSVFEWRPNYPYGIPYPY